MLGCLLLAPLLAPGDIAVDMDVDVEGICAGAGGLFVDDSCFRISPNPRSW